MLHPAEGWTVLISSPFSATGREACSTGLVSGIGWLPPPAPAGSVPCGQDRRASAASGPGRAGGAMMSLSCWLLRLGGRLLYGAASDPGRWVGRILPRASWSRCFSRKLLVSLAGKQAHQRLREQPAPWMGLGSALRTCQALQPESWGSEAPYTLLRKA